MSVYKAIAAVMSDLSKVGIGKEQKNTQQGFMYRGVDDVMNALAGPLSQHGLLILPRVIEREVTERQSKSGGVLFYVVLKMEFDFIASEDGSKHTVGPIYGEAMDSGDKASNKAMAIAYKYACFQTFCIPTEATSADPDKTTHEVVPSEKDKAKEYARRFTDAFDVGIDQAVVDLHAELSGHDELYRTTWGMLPSAMRRQIKEMVARAKGDNGNNGV